MDLITTERLRKLLSEVKTKGPNVCFRFRLIGEMWQPNFARMVELSGKGVVIHDETVNDFSFIADLSEVMQFEMDNRFQEFQPHFHYDVKPVTAS